MPMQGISPSGEKKVISVATIGAGADTTVCMMGGRFCVFTVKLDSPASSATTIEINLKCGGENSTLLPTSSNKTVEIELAKNDVVGVVAEDMAGFQTFIIDSITGTSTGKIYIEPMWC